MHDMKHFEVTWFLRSKAAGMYGVQASNFADVAVMGGFDGNLSDVGVEFIRCFPAVCMI